MTNATTTPDDDPPDYALLDRTGASRTVFFPRRDWAPPPSGAEDLEIPVAPDVTVAARFYPLDPSLPSVLFFHGNGEVASEYDNTAPLYHRAGLNLWVCDYRGYGRSRGAPSFAALVSDAHPLHDAFHAELDARGFSPLRLVMGRSLGAHPALELASRRPERLRGLIVESGAANLDRLRARLVGALPGEGVERLLERHHAKIASVRLPALVLHGARDELISLSSAVEFHDALGASPKELVVIPGAGHNDILWVGMQRYFEALSTFAGACAGRSADEPRRF